MRPRLICSELGEGARSWVPYGISVDTSEWERDLQQRADELVESYKAERRRATPRAAAAVTTAAATPVPPRRKK